MEIKHINMTCQPNGVSASMNSTINGVQVNFGIYGKDVEEITVRETISDSGYEKSRSDKYNLTGQRTSTVEKYEAPFTPEYFEELDAAALIFAQATAKAKEIAALIPTSENN